MKNNECLFELLDSFGGTSVAIKNAKRRMADYKKVVNHQIIIQELRFIS